MVRPFRATSGSAFDHCERAALNEIVLKSNRDEVQKTPSSISVNVQGSAGAIANSNIANSNSVERFSDVSIRLPFDAPSEFPAGQSAYVPRDS